MTYQELKDRLSKCELTLEKIKNGSYKEMSKADFQEKVNKLEVLKESLEKQIAEAGKKTAYIDGRPVDVNDKDELDQFKDNTDIDSIEFQGKKIKEMDRPPYKDIKPGSREDSMNKSYAALNDKDKEALHKIYDMLAKEKNELFGSSIFDDEDDEKVLGVKVKEEEDDGHVGTNTDADFEREQLAQLAARNEGDLDVGHEDDEPNMLRKDLYDIATYAAKLYKQLGKYDQHDGEVDFPHWWQSKVVKAREFMSSAQHYLEAEEKQPALDQLALEENTMNEESKLDKLIKAKELIKKQAPAMNKLPQDDPKRKAFIDKVKTVNKQLKDLEAKKHTSVAKTGADQELSNTDEAQATGFGTGQGRSKTISKGKESRPDLAQARKDAVKAPKKYVMKNGVPHKYDADGNLVPLKKMNEYRGVMHDVIEIIKDMAMNADGDEIEAAMELMEFIGEEYKIDFEFGRAGGGNYGRRQGNPYEGNVSEQKCSCCGDTPCSCDENCPECGGKGLYEEKATYCGGCGKTHKKSQSCPK